MKDKILHVYGQEAWHDDVWIKGTKEALKRLIKTIEEAIQNSECTAEFCQNDGEGYDCVVECVSDDDVDDLPNAYIIERVDVRTDQVLIQSCGACTKCIKGYCILLRKEVNESKLDKACPLPKWKNVVEKIQENLRGEEGNEQ